MYYLALQMLFGDRGKYIAMVIGVAFAAIIMTQQPAIFVGLLSRTFSFVDEVSLPDIWVMDSGVQYVEEHKPIRDTDLGKVRGVSGVEWAVPLYKGLVRVKLPDGNTKMVDLTGLDDATLVGASSHMIECTLSDFRRTDAVFVDKEACESRLRVTQKDGTKRPLVIGDVLEINDKRAVVTGYMKIKRNFVVQPQVYTTYTRAYSYSSSDRRQLSYVLVKARPGVNHKELCARIKNYTGLAAYTRDEFKWVNLSYWFNNTGIPINFGISVLLGFFVGAAVVGQTFYGFVYENIKNFAALKAMGLKNSMLTKIVIIQALVIGAIGYGIGVGVTALMGVKIDDTLLAFLMPPSLLIFSGVGVFLIIILSAVFAIRRVINVDPSIVFRS